MLADYSANALPRLDKNARGCAFSFATGGYQHTACGVALLHDFRVRQLHSASSTPLSLTPPLFASSGVDRVCMHQHVQSVYIMMLRTGDLTLPASSQPYIS